VNPRVLERVKELRQILLGFRPARVLLTANNYRVFDHLSKPLSAKNLSKKIYTDSRATEIVLDALASIGLIEKKNNRYQNTQIATQFLVSKSPLYQGDIIRHYDTLWNNWSGLDHVLKSGKPYHTERSREAFILGMHNIASLKSQALMKLIGLKGVKTALDLGGGPGTYSIEMSKRGVRVTLFDSPDTIEIAKKITRRETSKSIRFIGGDFMTDNIGKGYDLIFVSQILHAYSERDNLLILRKCRNALWNGGRIVIHEFPLSHDRIYPLQSALFSVNMLINTVGGRCYSSEEIRGWLVKVGLKDIKEQMLVDTVILSGAYGR
jgi:ubiquinone/menaquinone biosynthesis C-methylase UbiE